jgi:hypothetical protein
MSGFFPPSAVPIIFYARLRALTCLLYERISHYYYYNDLTRWYSSVNFKKRKQSQSGFFFFWHCEHANTRACTLRAYAYAPIDVKTMPLTKRKRSSRRRTVSARTQLVGKIYACVPYTILYHPTHFSRRLRDVLQRAHVTAAYVNSNTCIYMRAITRISDVSIGGYSRGGELSPPDNH